MAHSDSRAKHRLGTDAKALPYNQAFHRIELAISSTTFLPQKASDFYELHIIVNPSLALLNDINFVRFGPCFEDLRGRQVPDSFSNLRLT